MINKYGPIVIGHAVRCPETLDSLIKVLSPDDFVAYRDRQLKLVYLSLCKIYLKTGKLPKRAVLEAEINQNMGVVEGDEATFRRELHMFLEMAYATPKRELQPKMIRDYGIVQRYVDSMVYDRKVSEQKHVAAEESIQALVDTFENTRVAVAEKDDIFHATKRYDYAWANSGVTLGVPWMDAVVGRLDKAGLIGFIAPTGGGKTFGCIQVAVENALQRHHSLYFIYEQGVKGDIAVRAWAYATGMSYKDFDGPAETWSAEAHEAMSKVSELLSEYLHIYDMSGSKIGQGGGATLEIEGIVKGLKREGKQPKLVIIDWLGDMVDRGAEAPEFKEYKTTDVTMKFAKTLSRAKELGVKHNVLVLMAHQLDTTSLKNYTPKNIVDHADAHYVRSFGVHAWAVVTFGKKDVNNRMWVSSTKTRTGTPTNVVGRLDANKCKIVLEDNYLLNTASGAVNGAWFIERGSTRNIGGDE